MERIGQVLEGKYRIVRLLGEGGMGAVYEARHQVIDRRCAVKFLRPELARDAAVVGRFIQEAKAAAAIGHPGIIDIYDVGTSPDGSAYLVMEFLEGASVGDELKHAGKLPVARTVEIVVQALAALAVAHHRRIVHRDLKPDNLFIVQTAGTHPRVKILDFGISRMRTGGGSEDAMTRTGAVLGTPAYMAPEQAQGASDVDHRLDLYAMGVILFQCIVGRLPFLGNNYNQVLASILTQPFPKPTTVDPTLHPGLEQVILKATNRDRAERYASAEAMIADLVGFLPADVRARLDLPVAQAPGAAAVGGETIPDPGRAPPRTPQAHEPTMPLAADSPSAAPSPAVPVASVPAAVPTAGPADAGPLATGRGTPFGLARPATVAAAPPRKSSALRSAAIVVAALALVGGALFLWVQRGEPERSTPPVVAAPVAPVAPAPTIAGTAAAEDTVELSFAGLPPGATVHYDGAEVQALPLVVRRGEAAVPVEVHAPGFKPYKVLVKPDANRTIPVRLDPEGPVAIAAAPADASAQPPAAPRDAGAPREAAVSQPAREAGATPAAGPRWRVPSDPFAAEFFAAIVRPCWQDRLDTRRIPEFRVRFSIRTRPSGRVESPGLESSPDPQFANCVMRKGEVYSFDQPPPGLQVDFEVTLPGNE